MGRELRQEESQHCSLADLYVKGSVPGNILEPKSKELNQQRSNREAEGRAIGASRSKVFGLDRLTVTLPEAAARLRRWVSEVFEDDVVLILRALQVQVAASREQVR